jgi:hypothetical protein
MVAPCIPVEIFQRFRGAYILLHQLPDNGCSKNLRSVGQFLADDKDQHPRRHLHILCLENVKF